MTEAKCFHCGSKNVKSICFSDFGSNNIEIEELECLDCHMRTKIPLQNKDKQLLENMAQLESEGYSLNLDKVDKFKKIMADKSRKKFLK